MKFSQKKGSPVFTVDFIKSEPIFEFIKDDIINEFSTSLPGVLYVDGVRFENASGNSVGFRVDIVFVFDDVKAHISDVKFVIDTYLVKKGVLKKQDGTDFILKGLIYSENEMGGASSMFYKKSKYEKMLDSLKDVDISKTNTDFMSIINSPIYDETGVNKELLQAKLKGTTTSLSNCVIKGSLDSIIDSLAFATNVSGNSVLSKLKDNYYLTIAGSVNFKVSVCEVFTSEQSVIAVVPSKAEIVIEDGAVKKLASVSHNIVEEL